MFQKLEAISNGLLTLQSMSSRLLVLSKVLILFERLAEKAFVPFEQSAPACHSNQQAADVSTMRQSRSSRFFLLLKGSSSLSSDSLLFVKRSSSSPFRAVVLFSLGHQSFSSGLHLRLKCSSPSSGRLFPFIILVILLLFDWVLFLLHML